MTSYRAMLLSATATAALLGAIPSALAFEEVDWEWNSKVWTEAKIEVDAKVDLDPSGLVQVEKIQAHFGNLTATATVDGVYNENPGGGSGTATIDETFDVTIDYTDGNDEGLDIFEDNDNAIDTLLAVGDGDSDVTLTLVDTDAPNEDFGNVNEQGEQVFFDLNVAGTFEVTPDTAVEAADLPAVVNAATAVANNQSIESDVAMLLHDAQFAAGEFNPTCYTQTYGSCPDELGFIIGALGLFAVDEDTEELNEHTTIAGLLTIAAATGFINPAEIKAEATVKNILNASVDNSATAVTNNASYVLEALADPTPADGTDYYAPDFNSDHVLIADLTQWGYANVEAKAKVENVTLQNYTGFGDVGMGGSGNDDGVIVPIVSNTATAVGNNLSIRVGTVAPDI